MDGPKLPKLNPFFFFFQFFVGSIRFWFGFLKNQNWSIWSWIQKILKWNYTKIDHIEY